MWIWVSDAVALAAHREQLAAHGGGEGIRDVGLFESAMTRPRNLAVYAEPDAADLAAAYAFGIARNHPFIDGNKRTALVVARTFLLINGVNLEATQEGKYLTFLRLAEGQLSENELADWIRARMK